MMRVEYDRNMLRRVEKKLGRMKREAPKVLKTALNDTAKVGRKDLADKAQKTYAVKKSGFNKSMKINKARVNNLEAEIVSEGRPLGLKDFKVTPASYKPGSGQPPEIIKAKVVKSSSYKPLEKGGIKAFVTRFSSGHVAVAQRRGDARLPIKTKHPRKAYTFRGCQYPSIRISSLVDLSLVTRRLPLSRSFVEEFPCGAQLMAHYAEELLALLENVQVEQRHLQVGVVVTVHPVNHTFAHHGKLVLAFVGDGKRLVIEAVPVG